MTGWIVFGSILLVLLLLSLLRLGVELAYQERGLHIWIRVGRMRISLYPRNHNKKIPKKRQKAPKPSTAKKNPPKGEQRPAAPRPKENKTGTKTQAAPSPAPPKKTVQAKQPARPEKQQSTLERDQTEERGGLPLPLLDLISLGLDAGANLISNLQIDLLEIRYTIGGKEDPAWAAIQYGLLCAGEGGLVPVLENSFYRIKRREIQAQVDFASGTSLIWLKMILSMRVGQLLVLACQVGWAVFQAYRKAQTNLDETHQEGDENGTEASD